MATKQSSKRERIDTRADNRYMRRDPRGKFNESDDVATSHSRDRKTKAKSATKSGHGDKGDRKPKR